MTQPSTPLTTQQLQAQARTAATNRLREEHDERYQILLGEEYRKRSLAFKPKLTPAQRSRQLILELAREHDLDLVGIASEMADETAPAAGAE